MDRTTLNTLYSNDIMNINRLIYITQDPTFQQENITGGHILI